MFFNNKLFIPTPILSLTATPTPNFYHTVGDIVFYTYNVTNNGNTPLYNVTINNSLVLTTLKPNTSDSVNNEHIVTQADINSGIIVINATAIAYSDPSSSESTVEKTVQLIIRGSIKMTLTGNGTIRAPKDRFCMQYLMIGGGGSNINSINGERGQIITGTTIIKSEELINFTVGKGGCSGNNGEDSVLTVGSMSLIATGGRAGFATESPPSLPEDPFTGIITSNQDFYFLGSGGSPEKNAISGTILLIFT